MSLYGNKVKIDGVPCGLITRGLRNGEYQVIFEREHASLEDVEAINWRRPKLSAPCGLPEGYGFDVSDITYSMGTRCWNVTLKVREQYLGDVTGYQAQIDALEADKAQLAADNANLTGQLAEADETAIALFEELEAARAEVPAVGDETADPEDSGEVTE